MWKLASGALLILLAGHLPVHADPGGAGSSPATPVEGSLANWFCVDPVNAICSASDTGSGARAERVAAVRKMARERAERRISGLARAGFNVTLFDYMRVADIWKLSPPLNWLVLGIYHSALQQVVRELTTPAQATTLDLHLRVVRENLEGALDEHFAEMPGFERVRAKMRARLREVRLITLHDQDFMRHLGYSGYEQVAKEYREICGEDGLNQNAFAGTSQGKRYIMICPGWTIAGVGSGAHAARDLRNLSQVLAHELTHHIDYGEFEKVYRNWNRCMTRHHALELELPDLSNYSHRLQEMAQQDRLYGRELRMRGHRGEMTADFWGVQAQVRYLRSSALTLDEKVEFLRDAWGGFCSGHDDGSHPAGKFRIDTLLRRDPGLARLMECKPPESQYGRPGCSLQGPAPEGYF